MDQTPRALRLDRIGLTVADLTAACAFYEQRLGFRPIRSETRSGDAFAGLMGVPGLRAQAVLLGLGAQTIELVAFTPPGRPYPAKRTAADPWFQHFAVVVTDMDAAYDALGPAASPISQGGPQQLPPATGSVIAYKYRDPEGHPLELSWFPPAAAGPVWRHPPAGALFLGIDHSAIVVADLDASLAFYIDRLGMSVAARQVNAGPTQALLDGLVGTEVEIVALAFAAGGPHLELLAYRSPRPIARTGDAGVTDIAATRLILKVVGVDGLAARLCAQGEGLVSKGVMTLSDGSKAMLVRDPDGHLIEAFERN